MTDQYNSMFVNTSVPQLSAGVHAVQGRRSSMEDDHIILLDLDKALGVKTHKKYEPHAFFGVFDGHGGAASSEYARKQLASFITEAKHFGDCEDATAALVEGFMKCDRMLLETGADKSSGSTLVTALVRSRTLWVANAGGKK
eukprot:GEZU01018282.1.p1 GENE.GEZU01018282.1~~GEZU01018282.1.p1  ORF type:complete len:142 (-),score=18.54 GEZU01018282.1:58-483(-)